MTAQGFSGTISAAGAVSIDTLGPYAAEYNAAPGSTISDSFAYKVTDPYGNVSNTATITLNEKVIDEPFAVTPASGVVLTSGAPSAVAATFVAPNDAPAGSLPSLDIVSGPAFGSLSENAMGQPVYTANYSNATIAALNVGQTQTDSFTFELLTPGEIAGATAETSYHETVTIDGAGVPMASVMISQPNFGSVVDGQSETIAETFTITNISATGTLDVTGVSSLPAGYSISNLASFVPLELAPGQMGTETLDVVFNPTAVQSYNGNIVFTDNDATVADSSVAITGAGLPSMPTFQNDLLGSAARIFIGDPTVPTPPSDTPATVAAVIAAAQAVPDALLNYAFTLNATDIVVTDNVMGATDSQNITPLPGATGTAVAFEGHDYTLYNGAVSATTTSAGPTLGAGNAILLGGTYNDSTAAGTDTYTLTGGTSGENIIIGGANNSSADNTYILKGALGASNVLLGGNDTGAGNYTVNQAGNNGIVAGGQSSSTGSYIVETSGFNNVLVGEANNSSGSYTLDDNDLIKDGSNILAGGANSIGTYTLTDYSSGGENDILTGGINTGTYNVVDNGFGYGTDMLIGGANLAGTYMVEDRNLGGHETDTITGGANSAYYELEDASTGGYENDTLTGGTNSGALYDVLDTSTGGHETDILNGGTNSVNNTYSVSDESTGGSETDRLNGGTDAGNGNYLVQDVSSGGHEVDIITGGANAGSGNYTLEDHSGGKNEVDTVAGGANMAGGIYDVQDDGKGGEVDSLIAGTNASGNAADTYVLSVATGGASQDTFSIATGLTNPGAHVFNGGNGVKNTADFQNDLLGADARTFLTGGTGIPAVVADAQAGNLLNYVLGLNTSGSFSGIDLNNTMSPNGQDGDTLIVANLAAAGIASVQSADFFGGHDYTLYNGVNGATANTTLNVGTGNGIVVGGTFAASGSMVIHYTLTGNTTGQNVIIGGADSSTNTTSEYDLNGSAGGSNVLIGGSNTGAGGYSITESGNDGIAVGGVLSSASSSAYYDVRITSPGSHDVLVGGSNNSIGNYALDDLSTGGSNYLVGGSNNGGTYKVELTSSDLGNDVLVGGTNISGSYELSVTISTGSDTLMGGDNMSGTYLLIGNSDDVLMAGANAGTAASYVLEDLGAGDGSDTFSVATGLTNPGAHVFDGAGANNTADFQNDLLGADARTFLTGGTGITAVVADAQAGNLLDYVLGINTSGSYSGIDLNNTISPHGQDGDTLIVANLAASGLASIQSADFAGGGMNYSLYNGVGVNADPNITTTVAAPTPYGGNAIIVGGENDSTLGGAQFSGGVPLQPVNPSYLLQGSSATTGEDVIVGGNNTNAGLYEVLGGAGNNVLLGGNNHGTGTYYILTLTGAGDTIMHGAANSGGGNYIVEDDTNSTVSHTDILIGGNESSTLVTGDSYFVVDKANGNEIDTLIGGNLLGVANYNVYDHGLGSEHDTLIGGDIGANGSGEYLVRGGQGFDTITGGNDDSGMGGTYGIIDGIFANNSLTSVGGLITGGNLDSSTGTYFITEDKNGCTVIGGMNEQSGGDYILTSNSSGDTLIGGADAAGGLYSVSDNGGPAGGSNDILIAGADASGNVAGDYTLSGNSNPDTFEFNLNTSSVSFSTGNHEVIGFSTSIDTLEFTGFPTATGGVNNSGDLAMLQADLVSATESGGNTTLTFMGTGAPSLQLDNIAPTLHTGTEITDLVNAGVHIIVHA